MNYPSRAEQADRVPGKDEPGFGQKRQPAQIYQTGNRGRSDPTLRYCLEPFTAFGYPDAQGRKLPRPLRPENASSGPESYRLGMRVAIAGGHGKIALHLTRLLTGAGHEVISLIRNPAHSLEVEQAGGFPVPADLEELTGKDLARRIGRADVVVFAAGAGPGSGAPRKETVDYEGAVKLMEAARGVGAGHYVMISAKRADAYREGDEVFDVYARAKGRADESLESSGLPYTIVRPTSLTHDHPAGTVEFGPRAEGGKVTRADVAAVVAAVIERGPLNRRLELTAGSMPVGRAVQELE